MHNLSISLSGSNESNIARIAQDIIDRQELVDHLSHDLKGIEEKIQDVQALNGPKFTRPVAQLKYRIYMDHMCSFPFISRCGGLAGFI